MGDMDERQGTATIAVPWQSAPLARAMAINLGIRAVAALGVAGVLGWLLQARLAGLDMAGVAQSLAIVTLWQWTGALAATGISFWAVGRYDEVVHRHLATGFPAPMARRAGGVAIAVSQTIGLGLITGALLRWRMLPGLALGAATRLTAVVGMSFLAGWAIVTSVVLIIIPTAPFRGQAAVVLLVACAAGIVFATARGGRGSAPNLITLSRIVALTAIDTLAAAAALWILLPSGLALDASVFLPAVMLALGAGLVSGTPAGLGAFEMTLLALLAIVPPEPLVAAIIVWRLIYFAVPALIGAATVALVTPTMPYTPRMPANPALPSRAGRAETQLVRQGDLALLPLPGGAAWVAGRTPHGLIAMMDPLQLTGPNPQRRAIAALQHRAKSEARLPIIYKCSARIAVHARHTGLAVALMAKEAWINPGTFRLCSPARAGLRRKLRRAQTAGVTISCPKALPLADLSRIAAIWSGAHGGERGFSMGRFDADYIGGQRVYIAEHGGAPIAFITLHQGSQEWTLDLMRHMPNTPDGTMHTLVAAAINDAAACKIARFSLAAVPALPTGHANPGLLLRIAVFFAGDDGSGLIQFKAAFAPRWDRLYLCAPHRAGLVIAAAEIGREIMRPRPLVPYQTHGPGTT